MVKVAFHLLILSFLLFAAAKGHCRSISNVHAQLVSDGIYRVHPTSFLHLGRPISSSASETCEQTYGFLPCTTTILGNLFLLLAYGYLMYLAAKYLSTGSELLLQIVGPGIVGGLFLPILGALPDALLILVSGISGSKETAQKQVVIGMGLLAGSTVMLLTLLWGSCIVVGKCDLSENSTSVDSKDTKRCSLTGSGVTTDKPTSHSAKIMVISVIPFIIVQLTRIVKSSSGKRITILISLICALAFLLSYCLYQLSQDWIQRRRLAYAKRKHLMSVFLGHLQMAGLGRLLDLDGRPNMHVIEKIFERIDQDFNKEITVPELKALIVGVHFEDIDLDTNAIVQEIMCDFDLNKDSVITKEEFNKVLPKWLDRAKEAVPRPDPFSKKFLNTYIKITKHEFDKLVEHDEEVESIDSPSRIWFKAVSLLILGTVIAAVFADPLVDAVDNFSSATSIPSFFISFIAMPLATNSSEAVSAIIFAHKKKKRTTSLTFSEIYGAVTMNNTLCLAVFLALIYVRNLTWDFSAEVLVILIVCIVMGLFTSFRTTFPLWTCSVAYLLYPLSLVLVYVLDYCLGWS